MTRISIQGCFVAVLVMAPAMAMLGYEGGRVAEYRHAATAAEHAGAILEGALGACRSQAGQPGQPAAEREAPFFGRG